jgi:hypothetical protein
LASGGTIPNGVPQPFRYDVESSVGSRAGTAETASSTTVNIPGITPSYTQWVDICGGGYNNGGTTTTIGAVGGFTENVDTGQTSPPHGIFLDSQSANVQPSQNCTFKTATTATLAVAKTNRVGLRVCVPVLGNVTAGAALRRMSRGRRYG